MEAFIRFVLILIIIYYSLKLIGRYVLPWLFVKLMKRMQGNAQSYTFGRGFQSSRPESAEPEGKVTVTYSKKEKSRQQREGEYVDFEEVK
ncbi:uncharacterized protein DUF4834 [Breznakibacter xylanolyticus]|uniref:Uncharacterized protein DUF4834 n=1 Tax=Breznakibacter xylanolyticus TaxID=990 RepID=A0A2W7NHT3_9BACT|nr:DUF4834 family protein [Breznakibacter xylanolyticus]MBN2742731.1 DUF4834 family protein [Marinilabiliaceae bacterium]PZX10832.1 uncharacterized protein DUF4834 [Breznakibacter xylanolyticus]